MIHPRSFATIARYRPSVPAANDCGQRTNATFGYGSIKLVIVNIGSTCARPATHNRASRSVDDLFHKPETRFRLATGFPTPCAATVTTGHLIVGFE